MQFTTIDEVRDHALASLNERNLNGIYVKRLEFEINEIKKQVAEQYWLNLINKEAKFDSNPNHLVLPWALGMVADDPIAGRTEPVMATARYMKVMEVFRQTGKIPSDMALDADKPDIDIDCLPEVKGEVIKYAAELYSKDLNDGYGAVCSVNAWSTYKLKQAIVDTASATGWCPVAEAKALTKTLPEEVDDMQDNGISVCKGKVIDASGNEKDCKTAHAGTKCPKCESPDTETPTIGKLIDDIQELAAFNAKYPNVINEAIKLVGKIRQTSKHAGALIITDRPLYGNIPMAYDSESDLWKSLWTEGRNTQLSKFGYIKWDFLGLMNLKYIYECTLMLERNHGISFGSRTTATITDEHDNKFQYNSMAGWDDVDPDDDRFGHYYTRDGEKIKILLNDPKVLETASQSRTDAVFQFDTELAKRTLSNGVRSFRDLMVLNAMGHPGPMAMIPDYVERRDDEEQRWRALEDARITAILADTFNTIVYQEQLQELWQRIASFTAPEAQEARKAVAKKWRDKLRPIEKKWIEGAGPVIGHEKAVEWWSKMEAFGRYAFNKSHALQYCLVAYRCLWLKTYFPHEWWASVNSNCDGPKLIRYMNVARAEGVVFEPMTANNLSLNFEAIPETPRRTHLDPPNGTVVPGIIGLKGVGEKDAVFAVRDDYTSLEDFINKRGKNKILLERLIKLGAFKHLHENSQALWIWYQYHYCSDTEIKRQIRAAVLEADGWTDATVEQERARQVEEYRKLYPKRKKMPKKVENWKPEPDVSLQKLEQIYQDYSLSEILKFEDAYLGYYIHSPLELYVTKGGMAINDAKEHGKLEAVIMNVNYGITKSETQMCRLQVSDGIGSASLLIWSDSLLTMDKAILRQGVGIRAFVNYSEKYNSFSLQQSFPIVRLALRKQHGN